MKRYHLLIIALISLNFIANSAYSQKDVTLYIGTNGKITTEDHAIFMKKAFLSQKISNVQSFMQKDKDWEKISSEQYKKINDSTYQIKANGENLPATTYRIYKQQPGGLWKFKDTVKGHVLRTGTTKSVIPLLLDGEVTEYYVNGNIKSQSIYKDNELVSNKNWLANGDKYIDDLFYSVDSAALFNSGIKVMHQHVLEALKDEKIDVNNISGSVIVGFVVMENGKIDGIRIMKGLGPKLNSVIYNSIYTLPLKGNWTPAQLNGHIVRSFQVFPVNFKTQYEPVIYTKICHDFMEWDRKF